MINYIDELFLTEKTKKKIVRIKKDINNKKWLSKVCIIILAANENDVFDIVQLYNLTTNAKKYDDITIIGIAENKGAAIELCSSMSSEYIMYVNETGDNSISMRQYFINNYINR